MKAMNYKVPMSKLMKDVTCEISLTGVKTWKMRFWFGVLLFEFAAWVAGMKGSIKLNSKPLGEIV